MMDQDRPVEAVAKAADRAVDRVADKVVVRAAEEWAALSPRVRAVNACVRNAGTRRRIRRVSPALNRSVRPAERQ